MTDSNSKGTTYRLFKVAAELNIGKDAIVEFLRTKGHEIADKPTSALTQDMYDVVMGKFEREHKQLEKQRKKVDAYHEKSAKLKEELIGKPIANKIPTKPTLELPNNDNVTEEIAKSDVISHSDIVSQSNSIPEVVLEPTIVLEDKVIEKKLEDPFPIEIKKDTIESSEFVDKSNLESNKSVISDTDTTIEKVTKVEVLDIFGNEVEIKPKTQLKSEKKGVSSTVKEKKKKEPENLTIEKDATQDLKDEIKTEAKVIIIPEIEIVELKEEKIYIKQIEPEVDEIIKKYEIDTDSDSDDLNKIVHGQKTEKLAIDDVNFDKNLKGKKRKKDKISDEEKPDIIFEEYETSGGHKLIAPPPKLQGLTVLGKIEIAKNEEVKGGRDKKKRKRIKGAKVDIDREAKNQNQGQLQNRKDAQGKFINKPATGGVTGATIGQRAGYTPQGSPNRSVGGTNTGFQNRNTGTGSGQQTAPRQGQTTSGGQVNRNGRQGFTQPNKTGGTTGFQNRTTTTGAPGSNSVRPGFNNPNKPPQQGGNANKFGKDNKKRKRGIPVSQEEVQKAIRETRAAMDDQTGSQRQKRSRLKRDAREEKATKSAEHDALSANILKVTEFVTVAELASLMDVQVGQVIGKCIGLGLMVSINQRLDTDTIQLVADEFDYTVEFITEYEEKSLDDIPDAEETLKPRAPIVTIMGHVDHGKTSLLDYIRSASVVAGEAGGITQHIGAYSVQIPDGRKITFLDTPGHEAFTAMRARGAQVTDIVILVVAADDAVMPQTVEAISHAQAANVPMIVAINKIDKSDSNLERIKQQLADRGVLVEEWGGKYGCVPVSAKKGTGVNELLERILLEAELLDLKANPDREARGVVIEAELDKGKGIIANVLVQKGTLRVGDNFVVGQYAGRIRALLDERGKRITEVKPSEPAQVLGLDGIPAAGDTLVVLESEQETREIANKRQQLKREQEFKQRRHVTLDQISAQIAKGGVQNLRLIIKGDVDGSVEAVADSLLKLSNSEIQVGIVLKSVGEISESDVLLAAASDAIIIGFHVRPNLKARKLAEHEGVDIRIYQIIYEAVSEVKTALEGMLKPVEKEEITSTVEIRDIFKISKIGTIAGCYVTDGKITRNDKVRILRDGFEIFNGSIDSLKRHKDDVKEVDSGFECGISFQGFNDLKQGDICESFKIVEVKRKLESAVID